MVWEIKGADIQISPVYTCAIGDIDKNKGIGMRFPRLIKVRPDKKPNDATTSTYVTYKNEVTNLFFKLDCRNI